MANDLNIRVSINGDSSPFVKELHALEQEFGGALTGMTQRASRLQLFGKVQQDAVAANKAWWAARRELEALQDAAAKAGQPVKGLNEAIRDAANAADKAKAALDKKNTVLKSLRTELQAAGVDARDLAAAEALLTEQARKAAEAARVKRDLDNSRQTLGIRGNADILAEIERVKAAYATLARSGTASMAELARASEATRARVSELRREMLHGAGSVNQFRDALKSAAHHTTAMVAGFASLQAVMGGIRQIISISASFENLQVRMTSLMGSAQAGEAAFGWVREFAQKTPFQVREVADAFSRLKSFGIDPTNGSMQAIADTAAKAGLGVDGLNRITLALGQAWVKGKLQGEEIMQLVEAGVPAWDLLAQATGRTAAELQTMSQNGELGRDSIQQLFDAMGRANVGAASAQMDTWNGLVSNAIDLWEDFANSVGNAGLMDDLKQYLRELGAELARMKANGELKKWAEGIASAIRTVVDVLIGAGKFITQHADALIALAAAYGTIKLGGLARDLYGLVTAFAAVKAPLAATTEGAASAAGAFSRLGSGVNLLGAARLVVTGITSPLGLITAAAVGAVVALRHLKDYSEEATKRRNLGEMDSKVHAADLARVPVDTGHLTEDELSRKSSERLKARRDALLKEREYVRTKATRADYAGDEDESARQVAEAARLGREIRAVEQYQAKRLALEKQFASNVEAVRKGMTDSMTRGLAKELQLQDQLVKKLEEANGRLKAIKAERADAAFETGDLKQQLHELASKARSKPPVVPSPVALPPPPEPEAPPPPATAIDAQDEDEQPAASGPGLDGAGGSDGPTQDLDAFAAVQSINRNTDACHDNADQLMVLQAYLQRAGVVVQP